MMEEHNKYSAGLNRTYLVGQLSENIRTLVESENPGIKPEDTISVEKVIHYRKKYLTLLIEQERGEIDNLEKKVIDVISNNEILSENIEPEIDQQLSIGQKMADRIAEFGGSWTFIISFFLFIVIWISTNVFILSKSSFDPYPFILLNLILSCLAAIQAPIIMMSQNRQEDKDRMRSENDYKINLKAELEIKLLHDKIDHLIIHQNKKLLEVQKLQIDYFDDVLKQMKNK